MPKVGKKYRIKFRYTTGEIEEEIIPIYVSPVGDYWYITYRKAEGPYLTHFCRLLKTGQAKWGCIGMENA
ncbi:MAG: hypothetical protein J6Y78_09320 [Paludibacteraceae bacterium]|nr:hypothetical protein [Paludibacteraceae bacterium]